MIDFNLIVNEAKKIESFWDFSQTWFDVFTLIITILSLWLAYYLGERGYNRDKKDKLQEQVQLIETEAKLFKINLAQLLNAISKQLTALNEYKEKQDFSLKYYPDVQVDFLKFVNPKNLYENIGFHNKEKIDEINELFTSLFGLNDFRHSLKDSLKNYILRYSEFEKGFYMYRKLMYKMTHEIINRNINDSIPVENGFQINFGENEFARQFFKLNQSVVDNPLILDENKSVIRQRIIDLFILPTIELCKLFVPIDTDAIEAIDVANEVYSSWINMEKITTAHFNEINGHIDILENIRDNITKFLS